MLHALRRRLEREDEGFTLIELMVVVLIIAILIAIAVPTFLGARNSAQNRAAESDVRNALTAEKTYYTNNQQYTATASSLQAIEPSLNWVTTSPALAKTNQVYVVTDSGGDAVCLSSQSVTGNFYAIADLTTGSSAGTYYAESSSEPCTATFNTSVGNSPWKNNPSAAGW
jgi:type IV pilus assembly protein PilA